MSALKGPRRIAIAGASGFVGSALARHLESMGHAVIRIGRREDPRHGNIRWDPEKGVLDAAGLAGVRIVINLCGENIGQRIGQRDAPQTMGAAEAERPRELHQARLDGTEAVDGAEEDRPDRTKHHDRDDHAVGEPQQQDRGRDHR